MKLFTKSDLKRFIVESIWAAIPENGKTDRVALIRLINYRVDLFCKPLESWITSDGELDNIIEIIDSLIDDQYVNP